jgi:hypothetical protein
MVVSKQKSKLFEKKKFCVCHFCVDSTIQWSNRWVEKRMTPGISRLYFFYLGNANSNDRFANNFKNIYAVSRGCYFIFSGTYAGEIEFS